MATAEVQDQSAEPANGKDEPQEEGARSLVTFLRTLSDGELESEGSYQMHELCKRLQETAVMTHAKAKGKFKLTISLTADVNKTVGIVYNIETIAPKRPTTPALFWMTKGGNLSAQDTRQLELRPREVPSLGRKAKDIDATGPATPKEV